MFWAGLIARSLHFAAIRCELRLPYNHINSLRLFLHFFEPVKLFQNLRVYHYVVTLTYHKPSPYSLSPPIHPFIHLLTMIPPTPKHALITGCSEGDISSELAQSFTRANYHVFTTTRTLSKIQHLSSIPNTILLTLDVTSSDSIAACVAEVERKTPGQGIGHGGQ